MTFYVEKSLAHGRVRFGVSPRHVVEEIDQDPLLSTGKAGEFLRRRTRGFFFADTYAIGAPSAPQASSLARTPFLESLIGEGNRNPVVLAFLGAGAIFILLGLLVLAKRGAPGLVEIIIGLALIATPVVLTAQKRRQVRVQEDKVRAEHEERERRERERLDAYARALEAVRENASEESLAAAARERQNLEVPYRVWVPLAKRTVLQIGFDALARLGPAEAKQVSDLMSHAGERVGLERADTYDVKVDLYRIVIWHLLADDRLGRTQIEQLQALRSGFGVSDEDAPVEVRSMEQFDLLRGIDRTNLPRKECQMQLGFHEYCIHSTQARVFTEKGIDRGSGPLFLTNKRVIVSVKKAVDIPLMQIDDVEVNIDTNRLTIGIARPAKPVVMEVEQPVYTAALIDIATTLDERPKGFA